MLDYFELPKNGYHYNRIVQGFQRIFGATIFFGTEVQPDGKTIVMFGAGGGAVYRLLRSFSRFAL
jgi:hypothetical protein